MYHNYRASYFRTNINILNTYKMQYTKGSTESTYSI